MPCGRDAGMVRKGRLPPKGGVPEVRLLPGHRNVVDGAGLAAGPVRRMSHYRFELHVLQPLAKHFDDAFLTSAAGLINLAVEIPTDKGGHRITARCVGKCLRDLPPGIGRQVCRNDTASLTAGARHDSFDGASGHKHTVPRDLQRFGHNDADAPLWPPAGTGAGRRGHHVSSGEEACPDLSVSTRPVELLQANDGATT